MRRSRWSVGVCALCVSMHVAPRPMTAQSAATGKPTPLVLEENEGERRLWRPITGVDTGAQAMPGPFILKVDGLNGGSSHLVFGTENLAAGQHIETHKHPGSDEILFVRRGTARVKVADVVRVVHAGATVYIPADTWVSVANIGTDAIALAYVFSAPGFDDFMRAESAREGAPLTPLSQAEDAAIQKQHARAVVYKEPEECGACSGGE